MRISIMLCDITEKGEAVIIDPAIAFIILQSIPGMTELKYVGPDGCPVEVINGQYQIGNKQLEVFLNRKCESFHIDDCEDEALQLALEINKRYFARYGHSLQLFDTVYDYHQMLDPDLDVETLKKNIEEHPFSGSPEKHMGELQ